MVDTLFKAALINECAHDDRSVDGCASNGRDTSPAAESDWVTDGPAHEAEAATDMDAVTQAEFAA